MAVRRRALFFLTLMTLAIFPLFVGNAKAVTAPEIVVTSVYWGTNPMGGESVHPGDTNIPLSIVISNVGDAAAKDAEATLTLAPPFTYVYYVAGARNSADTASQSAGDIQAGLSFTARYILTVASDAAAGVHRLALNVTYKTARELTPLKKTITIDVPVWTGDVRVQHALTVPAKVYPGDDQVTVKVWLVNSGTGSTADLQVRLVLRSEFTPSSGGSDVFFLGTMQPGQVGEADFYLDISDAAQFGSYNLTLVSYSGSSNSQAEIGQVPLYVSEKVKFELTQVEPKTVHAGDSGVSIRVNVKNVGTVKADSVRIQLRVGNYFSGTLTDFLGTMAPGENKTAYFTVDVDAKAQPQTYAMDLRIDWTQATDNLDDTLRVGLSVIPAELPIPLIAIALILVVIVIALLIRRRRKPKP